jgi:hypothetical protein
VTKLSIDLAVDARHARAGYRANPNFSVDQIQRAALPLRLCPRRGRTIGALHVGRVSHIRMRDLPVNQDSCKGASLKLRYTAKASSLHPRHHVSTKPSGS